MRQQLLKCWGAVHCTWWVQPRGSRIRLYTHWVWKHRRPMCPEHCARHTVKWITSVCQAAKHLCALCWIFKKKNKGLGWKEATKKIHYYSMLLNYYESQCQLRPQKMSPKHWLVSVVWWMCGVPSPNRFRVFHENLRTEAVYLSHGGIPRPVSASPGNVICSWLTAGWMDFICSSSRVSPS